jgi:signal transduction histidine kinase
MMPAERAPVESPQHGSRALTATRADARTTVDFLDAMLETVMATTAADFGAVHLVDEKSEVLTPAATRVRSRGHLPVFPIEQAMHAHHTRAPVAIGDARVPGCPDLLRRALFEAEALACHAVPMLEGTGVPLGVLTVFFVTPHQLSGVEVDLVAQLARHAASFVETARANDQLRAMYERERHTRTRAEVECQRQDQFLATLSHELRQPLSAALPAFEIQKRSISPERRQRAREIIEQQVRQLSRLVDDLVNLSHIRRGLLTMRVERVDVRQAVEQAIDMAARLFDEKRHRTTIDIGFEPLWILGDSARLTQVFSNLLQNAAEYTADGGAIAITLERCDDRIRFRVRDNGVGIAPEALGRIFEAFERSAAEHDVSNLGIGLAVVRQIVEKHGGTVNAFSDGPSCGSEFVVDLPAYPA